MLADFWSATNAMQIREITIRNFRSIEQLTWQPSASLVCLIGRGDVGKSTVLDALELALCPRAPAITDTDFLAGDTSKPIELLVTVGELPEEALEDNRFGLHLRGWQKIGGLRDEPQGDDESVVTVRMTADASLEAESTLHTDRQEPKTLSARDRVLFGVIRLGPEIEKHLTWARYTAMWSATKDRDAVVATLANAFRAARDHVLSDGLPTLADVATSATTQAKQLGAYSTTTYRAGLDMQRTAMTLSGIAVHDGTVPVRLSGLGTRRLVSLAIQRTSVKAGAIVLIDEIEHGLEPHRIRYALKVLRDSVDPRDDGGAKGQVLLTTHSPTTLVELSHHQLAICRKPATGITIRTPGKDVQALLRRVPEALLAERVLACEGPTEVGLIRGLRNTWNGSHAFPFEALGTWLADGAGSQGTATALELASLGYTTALFRDSDVPLLPVVRAKLLAAHVDIYEWDGKLATEQRMFTDASWPTVQKLLDIAYAARTSASVLDQVADALGVPNLPSPQVSDWRATGKSDDDVRNALGKVAHKNGWYKNTTYGELVGETLGAEIRATPTTPMAQLLSKLEAWLYASRA
jgi:ABC-type nitrate/sulfonate/bicarbonate transport system ATPase subunit